MKHKLMKLISIAPMIIFLWQQVAYGNAEGFHLLRPLAAREKQAASTTKFSETDLRQYAIDLNPYLEAAIEDGTKRWVREVGKKGEEFVSIVYPYGCRHAFEVVKRLLTARYGRQITVKAVTGLPDPTGRADDLYLPEHRALLVINNFTGERYYLSFTEGQTQPDRYLKRRLVKILGQGMVATGTFARILKEGELGYYKSRGWHKTPPLFFKIRDDGDIAQKARLTNVHIWESRHRAIPDFVIDEIIARIPSRFKTEVEKDVYGGPEAQAERLGPRGQLIETQI